MYPIETHIISSPRFSLACLCLIVACACTLQSPAFAATDTTDQEEAYTDSVYSWGAWEFGIEPATSPRSAANRAINNRSKQLLFRPNDNAAYTATSIPLQSATNISRPPPIPVRPLVPATPSMPIVRPDGSGPVIPGAIPTAPNRRR